MDINTAKQAIKNVKGCRFASIKSTTLVPLTGGKKNEMQGRITKRTTAKIMLFSSSAGYVNQVRKELEKQGVNPDTFKLGERTWGSKIEDTPLVEHITKDGQKKYYVEVVFLNLLETPQYFLDGKPISKDAVIGVKSANPNELVHIRSYALDSVDELH